MPGGRRRRSFRQTDAFTRGWIVGLRRAGWSVRRTAAETGRNASTVSRIWRQWCEQRTVQRSSGTGARRQTSQRTDRRIRRHAVASPQATAADILGHVSTAMEHPVSAETVRRRLAEVGLQARRPLRRLPLTRSQRRARLQWCRVRATWTEQWHAVVFTDESRFCLRSDDHRIRVWRRVGHRTDPATTVERPTTRQRGVMVWGAISYNSRTPLVRIRGTLTAQRYVHEVLAAVALPYVHGLPGAIFQQDNARPHTAHISMQALEGVPVLPWPAYSPDLSPIENLWDVLGRRIYGRHAYRTEDELWTALATTWAAIPQDTIRTLIDSMPRRLRQCIAHQGGHTVY